MSKIKVDEIEGSTGSTITVPSGQTLTLTDGLAVASLPTVTVAKGGTNLTSFAAGDTLYATGATTLAKLTKGSAADVLTMNSGETAPEWAAAAGGGAWTLISRQVASTSANLTVTGLDSTYDIYAIGFSDMSPATTGQVAWLRFGDSGGINSGAADYGWWVGSGNTSFEVRNDTSDSEIELCHEDGVSNNADGGYSGMLWLTGNNSTSTMQNSIFGTYQMMASDGSIRYSGMSGGMSRGTHITLTQIQFLFASGNIASGQMTVWGIKHT